MNKNYNYFKKKKKLLVTNLPRMQQKGQSKLSGRVFLQSFLYSDEILQ